MRRAIRLKRNMKSEYNQAKEGEKFKKENVVKNC